MVDPTGLYGWGDLVGTGGQRIPLGPAVPAAVGVVVAAGSAVIPKVVSVAAAAAPPVAVAVAVGTGAYVAQPRLAEQGMQGLTGQSTSHAWLHPGNPAAKQFYEMAASRGGGRGPVDKGKEGVEQAKEKAKSEGETVEGGEVTVKLPSGKTSRPDLVTSKGEGTPPIFREAKKGEGARLSPGQKELKETLDSGGTVVPVGKRAAEAGLTPGEPTTGTFKEDRFP